MIIEDMMAVISEGKTKRKTKQILKLDLIII